MNCIVLLIVFAVTFVTVFVTEHESAFAHHARYGSLSDVSCTVDVSSVNDLPAIQYNGFPRSNPDGSIHPGDAFHFIFRFSHDTECLTFDVKPLEVTGKYTIYNALFFGKDEGHPVNAYTWTPQFLKTTHYYKQAQINDCMGPYGWIRDCIETFTRPEKPTLSLREDQIITERQQKLIYGSNGRLLENLHIEETYSWELARTATTAKLGAVHPFEDNTSQHTFLKALDEHCSELKWNEGCVYGHAELDVSDISEVCLVDALEKNNIEYTPEQVLEDYCISDPTSLEITVKGTGRSCSVGDGGNFSCKVTIKEDTANSTPQIITPSHKIIFDYPALPDMDGYGSKNLDGTYYVDDSIGIQSIPDVPFKESRYGTISFETVIGLEDRPLERIRVYICDDSNICTHDISGRRLSDFSHQYENGDVLYIAYGKDSESFGVHTVAFSAKMYNLDRYVATYTGTAKVLLVDYLPVFEDTFAYVNWNSLGNTTLGKQHAVGVEYLGSFGGGTLGDDAELHKDRRAKINHFHYPLYGESLNFDSFMGTSSDSPSPMFDIRNNSANNNETLFFEDISLNEDHIDISRLVNTTHVPQGGADLHDVVPHQSVLVILEEPWESMLNDTEPSFESRTNNTGMFLQNGYGRFYSTFEGLYDNAESLHTHNVTAYGTLITNDFAGYDTLYPVHYQYIFPSASSDLRVMASTIDEKQNIVESENITIHLVPVLLPGTVFLPDYYQKYGKHAQIDTQMTAMQIADFHDITNTITGKGTIQGTMNRTTVNIPERVQDFYGINADEQVRFSDKIHQSIEERTQDIVFAKDDFFKYPEYAVLATPGLYNMTMTVNGRTNVIEDLRVMHFNERADLVANVGSNNTLPIARYGELATIFRTDFFGDFDTVTVNNLTITDCSIGCSVLSNANDTLSISAVNIWGGLAHAQSVPIIEANLTFTAKHLETFVNSYGSSVFLFIILAMSLFALKRVWKTRKGGK